MMQATNRNKKILILFYILLLNQLFVFGKTQSSTSNFYFQTQILLKKNKK